MPNEYAGGSSLPLLTSEFSQIVGKDGYARVDHVVQRAKELGWSAVALTDHGEVSGHMKFAKACKREGLKALYGMEGYWHEDISRAKDTKKYPSDLSHICLIAADRNGLTNLWSLSSVAYDKAHHYHRPMADPDLLRQFSPGLWASDGCMITQFSRAIERDDLDAARQYYGILGSIFGDRFYVELHTWQYMDPQSPKQRYLNELMTKINQAKLSLANEMGIPYVVVNDSHHARPQDWELKEMNSRIRKDPDHLDWGQKADHMMDDDELVYWIGRHGIGADVVTIAIDNAHHIAEQCDDIEITPTLRLPSQTGSDRDDMVKFLDLVGEGFRRKVSGSGLNEDLYRARAEQEMEVICDRNFAGYFLVVHDYVRAAKTGSWSSYVHGKSSAPIQCGPSRGSAGGSLVAWLLGITAMDPIRYDLLFERFLTPDRIGYPDIDTDFPRSALADMKDYLAKRYKPDHVCCIGTVIRNDAKAMLRDLGRGKGIDNADIDKMSKIIHRAVELVAESEDEHVGWDQILAEKGGDLAPWVAEYPGLFDMLGQMVGVVKSAGKHPSGVLVNNEPLLGRVPLRTQSDRVTVTTQFDQEEVEELGGAKFDLLGIRHLDSLAKARELIKDRHGFDLDFENLTSKHMSEPQIWEPIAKGQTTGIFQIDTPGATRSAIELKPRNELDVAALVSIIRPGVKDAGEDVRFLARRAGVEPLAYDHPLMESITADTYCVLTYQEQMIRAAKELALFTPSEADELRRITAKKKADQIGPWRKKFLDGCINNPLFMTSLGSDPEVAEKAASKIWTSINASARYAFCKSHAMGYSLVTTWETWCKYHYPEEYITALLATDSKKLNAYLRDARRNGIEILSPDINESEQEFTIHHNAIRYGIDSVMGIASAVSRDILRGRPYTSLYDYLKRAGKGTGRAHVVNLLLVGAFDRFGDRTQLIKEYESWRIHEDLAERTLASPSRREKVINRRLNDYPEEWIIDIPDFSDPAVVYKIEQRLIGSHVTVDPLERYVEALEAEAIQHPDEIDDFKIGDTFMIGGQVATIKEHIITKGRTKGEVMAFVSLDYNDEEFEIVVFPRVWASTRELFESGAPVACRVTRTDRGCSLEQVLRLDLALSEMDSL